MQFWKYHGAGNDFILVDQRAGQWLSDTDTERIAFLCDRHFGIGADGLILLRTHPGFDFEMAYFNADGRQSSMCGNGGRCIVAFARQVGIVRERYRFLAIDGPHEAVIIPRAGYENWVELEMTPVQQVERLAPPAEPEQAFVLNTGSPHYVRFVPALDDLDMVQEGRAVRYAERFRATGINVNLVQEYPQYLRIRTYERGVEDETLACGTGVTAAALAFHTRRSGGAGEQEIQVKAQGGNLSVRFRANSDGTFSDIWLCGPAQAVFSGNI
ncbi:MAG: diaminopimelate epimerase [Lewinellaceae bacterium]|nr:diaminopimelate epimerase [Lewinellaceae bacterium]